MLQYIEALNILKRFNLLSAQYIEAYQYITDYLCLQQTLTVYGFIQVSSRLVWADTIPRSLIHIAVKK